MVFDPTNVKVVVCDVDDVLIEGSEDAKDAAWFPIFGEISKEKLAPVIKEAQQKILGGKGNRKNIAHDVLIRFVFAPAEAKEKLEHEVERRCELFDNEVQTAMRRIGVRPEARAALLLLKKRFPLYVNTGIPVEALLRTLQNLRISELFKKVYGTPGTKVENLKHIAEDEHVLPGELLFISDGEKDFEAAEEFGCPFVGVGTHRNHWNEHDRKNRPEILVTHFEEVVPILRV